MPDINTGTWNNDSINGYDFTAASNYNGGNYVSPAYVGPSYQILGSNFNLTISVCDTINGKIEGRYNGILVDNTTYDSKFIENGEFVAAITKSE